MPIELPV